MKYDFDQVISREGTSATKLEVLPQGAPKGALPLWVADMDFPCAQPIIDALHQRVDRQIFGYTRYGSEELKSAVQGWFQSRFGWAIDPSWMFYCPGVVPAIAFLIRILSQPGDGIVIQRPVYYPFTAKIEAAGRRVEDNALIRKGDTYEMDFEDLEKKMADPSNKGMILCSPHNPVGRVWTEEELRRTVEIAQKYDKWIISDEIHCDLTRMGVVHTPLLKAAPAYQDRIIVCTAPSKTFNLAGLQFSNIIIPNPEYQKKWTDLTSGCFSIGNCSPLGLAAAVAAYTQGADWLDQVREYIDGNIQYIKEFTEKNMPRTRMIQCEGTYLVWLDMRAYGLDSKEMEQKMIRQAGVILDEGYIFGQEGAGYERINVASPRSVIEDCMERICRTFEPA